MEDSNPQETIADLHVGFLDRCHTSLANLPCVAGLRYRRTALDARRQPDTLLKRKDKEKINAVVSYRWSHQRDLNPPCLLGRQKCCRYTTVTFWGQMWESNPRLKAYETCDLTVCPIYQIDGRPEGT